MRTTQLSITVCSLIIIGCIDYATGIHPVRSYMKMRQRFPDELVSHFPTATPPASQSPKLYYTPGPLQANEEMQLFVTLPDTQLKAIFTEYEDKAISHFVGFDESFVGDLEMKSGPWNRTIDCPLTSDDHIFLLFTNDKAEPAEAGIVINQKKSTVLYYCTPGKHFP